MLGESDENPKQDLTLQLCLSKPTEPKDCSSTQLRLFTNSRLSP